MIDLAFRSCAERVPDPGPDRRHTSSLTSEHTHRVIGSGANDPQKYDPHASRETLDHSLPYIFAVALEDGRWHHEDSYDSERAHRPETVSLWQKVQTEGDAEWERRYHSTDLSDKAFGGKVTIVLDHGTQVTDEIAMADAHPQGASPFARANYIAKFDTLAAHAVSETERTRLYRACNECRHRGRRFPDPAATGRRYRLIAERRPEYGRHFLTGFHADGIALSLRHAVATQPGPLLSGGETS